MDVVGSDYVYLSDECSQDVISLWSDTWSVGDPCVPEIDEFKDIFADAIVGSSESCGDNGDWLSDVLQPACPNTVAGYVPPQIVTSYSSSGECLPPTTCDDVLSPTDSGHYSITSSTTTAQLVGDGHTDGGDFLDAFEEHTSEQSIQLDNNSDVDLAAASTAASHDTAAKSLLQELDDESSFATMEFVSTAMSLRPQRVAARRVEIALAREGNECDDDDDDDETDDDTHFRSRGQLQAAEITSSRRGRNRAAEVNRNALNARINRQKKKAYMSSLEEQKARLLRENKRMKSDLSSLVSERNELKNEVSYLRSVLANDSILAKLVERINGPPLKLSARFDWDAQKRKDIESDHNYGPPAKVRAGVGAAKVGGICLHVTENQLSVELCHRCSRMADGDHSSSFDP